MSRDWEKGPILVSDILPPPYNEKQGEYRMEVITVVPQEAEMGGVGCEIVGWPDKDGSIVYLPRYVDGERWVEKHFSLLPGKRISRLAIPEWQKERLLECLNRGYSTMEAVDLALNRPQDDLGSQRDLGSGEGQIIMGIYGDAGVGKSMAMSVIGTKLGVPIVNFDYLSGWGVEDYNGALKENGMGKETGVVKMIEFLKTVDRDGAEQKERKRSPSVKEGLKMLARVAGEHPTSKVIVCDIPGVKEGRHMDVYDWVTESCESLLLIEREDLRDGGLERLVKVWERYTQQFVRNGEDLRKRFIEGLEGKFMS